MTNFLEKIIKDISLEEKIKFKTISDGFITILTKDDKTCYLNEYFLGLNSSISTLLCDDKYAMYEVLKEYQIPVLEYKLIFHSGDEKVKENIENKIKILKDYYHAFNHHIVLKPNLGYGGRLVFQIDKEETIKPIFYMLLENTNSIVVNPFYEIKNEYRVIILNNQVRLIYKKVRGSSWQFNLSKGSFSVKDIDSILKDQIISLAYKVYNTLKLKFASIDIVELEKGEILVLEVNNRVTLEKYCLQHPKDYELVKNIYKDAIKILFDEVEGDRK